MTKQDTIAAVLGSGLFDSSDESRFSHYGCEFCGSPNCSVYDVTGYPNLEAARAKELEDFQLCQECIMNLSGNEPEFDRINHGPFEHPVSEPDKPIAPRVYKCVQCGGRRCGKRNEVCDVCKDNQPTYKQIRAAAYSQWK